MATAPVALKGVIRGNVIELERNAGFPDGEPVLVTVHVAKEVPQGLLDAFGGWGDDPEGVDEFVRETYRARETDRRNEPEP